MYVNDLKLFGYNFAEDERHFATQLCSYDAFNRRFVISEINTSNELIELSVPYSGKALEDEENLITDKGIRFKLEKDYKIISINKADLIKAGLNIQL